MPLTITLPLPHPSLWPNSRKHWAPKAKQTKAHRQRAQLRTLEALAGHRLSFAGYSLAFHYPEDKRRRDDDNAAASCKAYRDGIADALHIDDHNLPMVALPTFAIDREHPRLEITLHPEKPTTTPHITP